MGFAAVPGSYVAMVGIEGYMKTKGRWKGLKDGVKGMVIGSGKKEKEGEGKEKDKHPADGTAEEKR